MRAEKRKTEEQAQRLTELDEAKSRFFANISHEFRTPLTLILGPLQDALDRKTRTNSYTFERHVPIMHRAARRLLRLVNQLLLYLLNFTFLFHLSSNKQYACTFCFGIVALRSVPFD